jgi:hypothetical protein
MKKRHFTDPTSSTIAALLCVFAASHQNASAAAYQKAVKALNPTYYFELNETTTANGVLDSMHPAGPRGTYNGNYNGASNAPMVGFAGPMEVFGGTTDGKNLGAANGLPGIKVPGLGGLSNVSHNSNNVGHIILPGPNTDYGANAMTVAMFLKANFPQGGDRVFTNNLADATQSFQLNVANNGLVISVDPNTTGLTAERTLYLSDGTDRDRNLYNFNAGWFHVVASTSGATGAERASNIKVWINGVDRTDDLKPDATGWGINTNFAKIGGRRDNPLDSTTHSGAQDEVSIWMNRVLTDAEVKSLWAAATVAPYTEKVVSLNPKYYFKLDEKPVDALGTPPAGVVDYMGNQPPGSSYNGNYLYDPAPTDPPADPFIPSTNPEVGFAGPTEVFGGTTDGANLAGNPPTNQRPGIPIPGLNSSAPGAEPNRSHNSRNKGHIVLGGANTDYGANAMTVSLFLKADFPQGGDRIFTNNLADGTKSFQLNVANNGLVISVDPNNTGLTAERTLWLPSGADRDRSLYTNAAGWFHVIATTEGATGAERASNIKVWVNGVNRTDDLKPDVVGWGINTNFAKIGGRRDNPTDTTTHSGAQDEVAIWLDRALTDSEALSMWTSLIAPGPAFNIAAVSRDAISNDVTLTIESVVDGSYAVERASNPAGPWTLIKTDLVATGSTVTYTDTSETAHTAGKLFYRSIRTR